MREEGSRSKSYTDDRVFPGVSRISAYSADIGGMGGHWLWVQGISKKGHIIQSQKTTKFKLNSFVASLERVIFVAQKWAKL